MTLRRQAQLLVAAAYAGIAACAAAGGAVGAIIALRLTRPKEN